jgi:hydroxyacylglutathione hydrolase
MKTACSVSPLSLGFVTAFLVRGEKDILVDAGIGGSGRRILAALHRLGVDSRSLSLVLVTHGHGDHFGGLAELLPDLACPVAVHALDADCLRAGRGPAGTPIGGISRLLVRMASRMGNRPLTPLTPDIAFTGSFDLRPYGIEGTVELTPGHTPGSVSVFLGNGEAIVGDLLRGSMVSAGSPRWPFMADNFAELKRSVGRVLDQRPLKIWTSHGGPLTADAVRAFLKEAG